MYVQSKRAFAINAFQVSTIADLTIQRCRSDYPGQLMPLSAGFHQSFLCLGEPGVVVDLYNKAVVGWSMSYRQTRDLVLKAV